jgi:hypothetical protein
MGAKIMRVGGLEPDPIYILTEKSLKIQVLN